MFLVNKVLFFKKNEASRYPIFSQINEGPFKNRDIFLLGKLSINLLAYDGTQIVPMAEAIICM